LRQQGENLKKLWQKAFNNTDPTKGPTKTEIFQSMSDGLKESLGVFDIMDLDSSKIDQILNAIIKAD